MVRHIVMWKFRPGTEAEQQRFLDGLRGLQGVIPEMLKSEVVIGIGGDYDAGLVSEFASMEDLHRYKQYRLSRQCVQRLNGIAGLYFYNY